MKKLIKTLFVLLVLILISLALLTFTPIAGSPIKKGIEYFGSKTLNTKVTVEKVNLNIAKGSMSLKGLRIANLEKFKQPYLFELGEVNANIDLKSLLSDVVIVKSINVSTPIIYIENFGENLKAVTENLEVAKTKQDTKTEEMSAANTKETKKLAIEKFNLNGAQVVLNNSVALSLPNIELRNLGTADNAATPIEVITEVFKVITRDTLKAVKDNIQNNGKKAINSLLNKLF